MDSKPSYAQLEQRVQELERRALDFKQKEDTLRFIETRQCLVNYANYHSLDQLLSRALDEVGTFVNSPIGFYHFVEEDQKNLSLQQWSTRTLREFCQAEGKGMHYSIDQAGVWVDCVHAKKPVIHNDYASLPHKKGLPQGHAKVIRELIVPVMRENKVVAILGVGNKPTEYTQRDVNIVSYLADVTWEIVRRKRMEEALQKERDFVENLLNTAQVIILVIDTEGRIVRFNRFMEEISGYTLADIAGKEWIETLIPSEERKHIRNIFSDITGEIQIRGNTNALVKKDGGLREIEWHYKTLKDIHGNVLGLLAVGLDITDRQAMEAQLHQAQKLESIKTLAAGIAHDFNNMLTVITGNTAYALSHFSQDNELFEVLLDAQKSAKQAQALTQQLLTFTKGGAPVKKITDLNQLIRESATFVTRGAESTCEFKLSDDLWTVEVDQGQITQVVSNLVINANQAMPEGGTIKIQTENAVIESNKIALLPPGRYVRVTVRDYGIGIANSFITKIFDPYFSTKQKGSGLGLATAYSIIKRHGGHIAVESTIGIGTTFYIYLPASNNMAIKVRDKDEARHIGHGKILVMDDQKLILNMVRRILNRMHYETSCATDGEQAIEMYKKALETDDLFKLVILDLTVPGGMGGVRTMAELLRIDPSVKAVVSSGHSSDPIMANYQDYGFCDVMCKPYTTDEVAQLMNKIFGEKL